MCGRYALWGIDLLGQRYLIVDPTFGFRSKFNIAPRSENPVIVAGKDGNDLQMMEWGLVPEWGKDPSAVERPINARVETISEKKMFRQLLQKNRCIIPANGYFEWKTSREGKTPYFICCPDKAIIGFAGLYETWQNQQGNLIRTYTIITTEATGNLRNIHHRMPVILQPEREQEWLSKELPDPDTLKTILTPYEKLIAYPVSPRVNSVSAEGEDLVRELEKSPEKSSQQTLKF